MKKIKFVVVLLMVVMFSYYTNAQTFIDYNTNQITAEEFKRLSDTDLFKELDIKRDSLHFKKLVFKKRFGSLSKIAKSQLNKHLFFRYAIDSTKIWVIHYVDSLPPKVSLPKKSHIVYLDDQKIRHKHEISYKDFVKRSKTHFKEFKNNEDVTFIHFWRAGGQDYPQELFKSLNWYYDPSNFIKRLFSLGIIHFKTQIIYPNGDYVSFYDDKNKVELKRLIKSKKFVKERQKHQKIVAKRLGL
jgi:hypothetical protein